MEILKILFILVLLIFTGGEVLRFQVTNDIAVVANDIGVGILVVTWFAWHIFTRKKFKLPFLAKAIFLFIGGGILSLLVNSKNFSSQELGVSFLYLLRWGMYAGVYFVVSEFNESFKKKIIYIMILVGLLIVFLGYIQYFFYPNLRNLYYLGWDEHLYRMFSSFLDPNFAGAFFVLLFLFLIDRLFLLKKRNKYTYALFTITILALFAVFLTYSRTALLMLFAGITTFLVLRKKTRWVIGFFAAMVFFLFLSQNFLKSEGTNLLRIASSNARFDSLEKAIIIIKDNPVFGVGFNTYRYAQKRYGFLEDNGFVSHAAAGTDNSFLFVLATTGVVGFIAYIFLWFRIIRVSISDFKTKPNNKYRKLLSIVLFSSVVSLFLGSFFINLLFYPFIMEWMWILVGLSPSTRLGLKESR